MENNYYISFRRKIYKKIILVKLEFESEVVKEKFRNSFNSNNKLSYDPRVMRFWVPDDIMCCIESFDDEYINSTDDSRVNMSNYNDIASKLIEKIENQYEEKSFQKLITFINNKVNFVDVTEDNTFLNAIQCLQISDSSKQSEICKRYYKIIHKKHLENVGEEHKILECLGGDRIFNFNENKENEFKKALQNFDMDEENKKKLENILSCVCEIQGYPINCSMLYKTGNLNRTKQNCKLDSKPQAGIEQFKIADNLILFLEKIDNKNLDKDLDKGWIKEYLKIFSSAQIYAEQIYNIDERMYGLLIKNAQVGTSACEDLVRYMKLALLFWENRVINIRKTRNNEVLMKDVLYKIDEVKNSIDVFAENNNLQVVRELGIIYS